MIREYQVTLIDENKKYRPVSCILKKDQVSDLDLSASILTKKALISEGVKKICLQRGWRKKELMNFTNVLVRAYDRKEIEREKKERYEKIKEAKYNSGEWKRPKNN